MDTQNQTSQDLAELKNIRQLMERSSRFISASGLSGVAAGVCALIGSWLAHKILSRYYTNYNIRGGFSGKDFNSLKTELLILAVIVFVAALSSAFLFTYRKARSNKVPIWDHTTKRLLWNLALPLIAGGIFCLGMLMYNAWMFVAPACLVFYGLALVNASKYTITDIRYLGYAEIVLGLVNIFFISYSLYFWAVGFGFFHIFYGAIMWNKYERNMGEEN